MSFEDVPKKEILLDFYFFFTSGNIFGHQNIRYKPADLKQNTKIVKTTSFSSYI